MEIVDRRYCTREMVSGSQATIKNSDTCLTHFWQVPYGCPTKYYCFTSVWRLQFWMLDVFHTSFEDCHTQNTDLRQFGDMANRCKPLLYKKYVKCLSGNNPKNLRHVLRISVKCLTDVRRCIAASHQFGEDGYGCRPFST